MLCYCSINGKNLSTIVREMKNLKTLCLNLDTLDIKSIGSSGLSKVSNSTVTKLTLYSNSDVKGNFRSVLNIFKGVKNLELYEVDNSASFIQPFASKLESLTVASACDIRHLHLLQFPNLKRLTIGEYNIPKTDSWQVLASRSPLVTTLIITDSSIITTDMFAVICKVFKHLQHFETLYRPDRLTSKIIDFICDSEFPRNIRFLKITQTKPSADKSYGLTDWEKENRISKLKNIETERSNFFELTDQQKTALYAKHWLRCIFD